MDRSQTAVLLPGLLLLSALVPGISAFTWNSTSPKPGLTILTCVGRNVSLQWAYGEVNAEHNINEEWAFIPRDNMTQQNLAYLFRNHFFTETNIHQLVDYLKPSGITLISVKTQDDGYYIFRVNVDRNDNYQIHETNVSLVVVDPQIADGKTMVAHKLPGVFLDPATGEYHVQLACAPSDDLGNMPVEVLFTTPDNVTLKATGFSNGNFTVFVPNPVLAGNYTCQVSNPLITCLDSDAPLLTPAVIAVDGCAAQLDVTTATLNRVRQELQSEREAHKQCIEALRQTTTPIPATTTPACADQYMGDCAVDFPDMCSETFVQQVCLKTCHMC